MLTRLEVSGFKNLRELHVEFGAFTCIAGTNGVGKSNLFDAIQFLSLLAQMPIMEAAQRVRVQQDGELADPLELFWTDGERRAERLKFGVEMIVPSQIKDDFGREAEATSTFLRYDLELGYEPPQGLALGRLYLMREELTHINKGEALKHLRFTHSKRDFRDKLIANNRLGKGFISTNKVDGQNVIHVHPDNKGGGRPAPSPAYTAPMTIVGSTTSSSDPTILAAKREMQSWRMLALEPSAMRASDAFASSSSISPNGAHMAATLYRLAPQDQATEAPSASVYSGIANRLADLIRVQGLRVNRDDTRRLLTLELSGKDAGFLPARALSDGTLRFLALCIMEADPSFQGTICFEEPENGIHPARLPAMVDLLKDLAVDPEEVPGLDNPMRQVIINTHSPKLVQQIWEQDAGDLLFAEEVLIRDPNTPTEPIRALQLSPILDTWRSTSDARGVGLGGVLSYLEDGPGVQLFLERIKDVS